MNGTFNGIQLRQITSLKIAPRIAGFYTDELPGSWIIAGTRTGSETERAGWSDWGDHLYKIIFARTQRENTIRQTKGAAPPNPFRDD
jgi:hypothetical protein